jgi:hypothetical protein
MKRLSLLLFLVVCLSVCALAQNVRYSAPFPSVSSTYPPLLQANIPPNSPTIAVCNSPANQVPCTNYATTYTSASVACPNGAQDTPDPQPSACQSTGDGQGNIGFWAPPGKYDYTVCIVNSVVCYGPYTITLAGGAGSAIITVNGGSQLAYPVNFQNGTNTTASNPSGSNVQFNVASATSGAPGVLELNTDLSGSATAPNVAGLKGVPFCSGYTPTNGQAVEYTTGGTPNPCYAAVTPASGFTAGGDLSGSSTSQTVKGVNNVPLCTGFTPTNGQVLEYTTASSPNPCYTAATIAGISGLTSGTFPVATGSTTIANSVLTNVSSPSGINYSLGGGLSWQLDSSDLLFNTGISGSSNILIANTYNPGGSTNAGGIIIRGAPTSGSACAGPAYLQGGLVSANGAGVTVAGECQNGFGLIGGSITIATGLGTGGNTSGTITLSDQIGTFIQGGGHAIESGMLQAASFAIGGTTFTALGCSNGTLVGGNTAGKMTIGANSCTVTITMGGSQTAAHEWSCGANDETTAAGNTQLYFTGAGTTTTAVLSVPSTAAASDVIDFRCTSY